MSRVGLRGEARERSNDERVGGHALREAEEVLLREHRRRAEDGDLPAFARDPERGTKSDFGLAEANVAAHEPIHRRGLFEVALDVADRDRLIGRLVERKRRFEGAEVVGRRGERHTARGLSLRVELEELVGHLADVAHRALLRLLERRAAEPIELRRGLAPRELLDLVEAVDGEVEPITTEVFDRDEIDARPAYVAVQETVVAADAVLDVHDEVPDRERLQILDESARLLLSGGCRARSPFSRGARSEHVLLGDDSERLGGGNDATRELAGAYRHRSACARVRFGCCVEELARDSPERHRRPDAPMREQRGEPFDLRLGAGDDHRRKPLGFELAQVSDERLETRSFAFLSARGRDRAAGTC